MKRDPEVLITGGKRIKKAKKRLSFSHIFFGIMNNAALTKCPLSSAFAISKTYNIILGSHIEWLKTEETLNIIQPQHSCCGQGCHPPDQAAQGPIQLGLEYLQGWGSTASLGSMYQCLTTL